MASWESAVPVDIEDWGLVRIFHEAGRLLRKHFRAFLPAILVFTFPASMIKVLHSQFLVRDFIGPLQDLQGSTDQETSSISWTQLLLSLLLDAVPTVMFFLGYMRMLQIYLYMILNLDSGYKTDLNSHSESFYTFVKSAFIPSKAATEELSWERSWTTYKRKLLRVLVTIFVIYLLFVLISTSGIFFTPESVAAMGLPPWSIFLFTFPIVLITTLASSYLCLVAMLLGVWMRLPATPTLT